MGSAIVRGLRLADFTDSANIFVFDNNAHKTELLRKSFRVANVKSAGEAVAKADITIIAVKPPAVVPLVRAIEKKLGKLPANKLFISVAAGLSIRGIQSQIKSKIKLGRVMPNLPCVIGSGVSGIYSEHPEVRSRAEAIFSTIGMTFSVKEESDLDIVTGLASCGPAFIFLAIEAMADAGVKLGLSRETSLKAAAQTVYGAAGLVLAGEHPAILKDRVASPGGTTAAGLYELEKGAFRGTLISAVQASTNRAKKMIQERRKGKGK